MNDSKQPCFLCGKQRTPAACCEDRDRVVKAIENVASANQLKQRPQRITMCKDCCIGLLEGHHCVWWDFCWRC